MVGLTTSATAWLLDPAVKKVFVDKDVTLAWLIPLAIILTFTGKRLVPLFCEIKYINCWTKNCWGVAKKNCKKRILFSDIQTLDSRHSGKYIANIMFDSSQVQHLVSTGVLNLMKDSFSVVCLVGLMFYQNWKLAIFAIFMILLAAGLAKNLGKKNWKSSKRSW